MILSASCVFAKDKKVIRFTGQWPFHPTKAVVLDTDRKLVFLADGERLCILNYQLQIQSILSVSKNADIGGIYYDDSNKRIYVASRTDGLWIIDLSDEHNPSVLNDGFQPVKTDDNGNETISEVIGVYVENGFAYIAGGLSGVQVVDVSTPASPETIVWIDNLPAALLKYYYPVDTVVSGGYLYIGDLVNGVHIYDIADQTDPELKKTISLPNARDLTISGSRLFVAMEGNGLQIVDITDPEDPKEAGLHRTNGRERTVAVDGNTVYVGYDKSGIHVLDISELTIENEYEPFHNPAWEYADSGAKSIALDSVEKLLFITDDVIGLQKIDVTDPAAMTRVQSFDSPADVTSIAISGDFVYALDDKVGDDPGDEGLRIFEISPLFETLQFQLTGFLATPGNAQDIHVMDNYAYVADGTAGLLVIDISEKAAPKITGFGDTPGLATGVYAAGDYAYVADGAEGFAVFNIENPENPIFIRQVPTTGIANDVLVSGTHLYVAEGESGLTIYDISSPGNPQSPYSADTPGDAQGVAIDGNLALVADGDHGLVIINIEDQTNPGVIGSFNTAGYARKVDVSGNYAYVADGKNGISTIDITDPAAPVPVSEWSFNSTGNTTDVVSGYTVNENLFVIAADGPSGVIALNPAFEKDYDADPTGGDSGSGCFVGGMK